jgi:hypothetical protein
LKTASSVLVVGLFLILSAHRLPAPIQEIPEPTATPRPKPVHHATSTHKSDAASADASKKTPASRSGGGTATVFIYRPAGFPWGMYSSSVIAIDGAEARSMGDSRYSVRKLSPGKHVFEARGGVLTHQRVPVEIDLQGGQNYDLRMSIDAMGFPEGKIIFTHVPDATGVAETAKLTQGP